MIELKRKPIELVLRVCSVALAVTALILISVSIVFTFGGDAPGFFGSNIYIVKTDAFELIKKGNAVLVSAVPPEEIHAGNIVIFQNSEKQFGIAEVHEAVLSDGVYSFSALSERGAKITLSQGQITGKAMQVSAFLGGLIGFAKSPSGVLIIAVLPCIAILLYEAVRAVMNNFSGENDVSPVKKQEEVPTFIPRQKVTFRKQEDEPPQPDGKVKAAINAYKGAESNDYPLFTAPNRVNPERYKPPQPPAPKKEKTYPLSQKRLNEVIAETNARRGSVDDGKENARNTVNTSVSALSETVKRYIPKKPAPAKSVSTATSSLPRLDQLLNDDSDTENERYDIADILSSLEKK